MGVSDLCKACCYVSWIPRRHIDVANTCSFNPCTTYVLDSIADQLELLFVRSSTVNRIAFGGEKKKKKKKSYNGWCTL